MQMILIAVNTLAVAGVLGMFIYTKLLWERPPILETAELKEKKNESKKKSGDQERVMVNMDDIRINIASTSSTSHYVNLQMALECANEEMADLVKANMTRLMDKTLSIYNRKDFDDLNTIQGRLILKEQLMDEFNQMLDANAVTDIFYNTFLLQ